LHAVACVAKLGRAVDVGADPVTQHHVAGRAGALDVHTSATIAGDDVGGPSGGAAHGVRRRAVALADAVRAEAHPSFGVAKLGGTGDVGADHVAQHHVARCGSGAMNAVDVQKHSIA